MFGKRISEGLLDQIEERNVVFIEDGNDINEILRNNQKSP